MLVNITNQDLNNYDPDLQLNCTIHEKSYFTDELKQYALERLKGIAGDKTPFSKLDQLLAFRPTEITIWGGINGHGKTSLLSQIALNFVNNNKKVLIISLEMPAIKQLHKMLRQACGHEIPTNADIDKFNKWKSDRLYLYDYVGSVDVDTISKACQYAKDVLDVDHIIIDSMTKCIRGEDSYNEQKDFIAKLTDIAKALNIHIHLVHHIRKTGTEKAAPDKMDLKGSSAISDLTDNLMIVFRNKGKEDEFAKTGIYDHDEPDSVLYCSKQRHGDWEGAIKLWYHKGTQTYSESSRSHPEFYF